MFVWVVFFKKKKITVFGVSREGFFVVVVLFFGFVFFKKRMNILARQNSFLYTLAVTK